MRIGSVDQPPHGLEVPPHDGEAILRLGQERMEHH
jgi:hypothetical protein